MLWSERWLFHSLEMGVAVEVSHCHVVAVTAQPIQSTDSLDEDPDLVDKEERRCIVLSENQICIAVIIDCATADTWRRGKDGGESACAGVAAACGAAARSMCEMAHNLPTQLPGRWAPSRSGPARR